MLVPLPSKVKTVEQDVVALPEPISVTDLPPEIKPEPTLPPAAFVPEPAPVIEAPPPDPIVPQPPVAIPVPEPSPEPSPTPPEPVEPEPVKPDPVKPDPSPTNDPDPAGSTSALSVTRSVEGTERGDATQKLRDLISFNTTDSSNPLTYKQVKGTLPLEFPSDNYCLKDTDGEIATSEKTSAAIVVENDTTDGSLFEVDGSILQLTGYKDVDAWVESAVFPSDEIDPNATETLEIPDIPDFDFLQWVTDNYDQPLLEDTETSKAFIVSIEVDFVNNCQ